MMKCSKCDGRGYVAEEVSDDLALSNKGQVCFQTISCIYCDGTGEESGIKKHEEK